MKNVIYLFGFFILTLISCNKEDDDITPKGIEVVDETTLTLKLQEIFKKSDFPGFTIGIAKNGNSVYQKSFGLQNIEKNIPYTNQTIQPIASLSKTFIGVALVKGIELGYFDLETPINKLLETPIINPKNKTAEIKIKHLVNHTSGLSDNDNNLNSYYILKGESSSSAGTKLLQQYGVIERTPKTLEEFIKAYFYEGGDYYSLNNFKNFNPGDEENYTNAGAALAGYLIETSSGLSYQDFLKKYIFDLLNMNNTTFAYQLPNNRYATLYFNKETPLPFYDFESFPDGGVKTSNEDLMKYMLNMIKGIKGETSLLFDKKYYNLLFTKTSEIYSVFWGTNSIKRVFGHSGGDPGLSTDIRLSEALNSGYFLLTNYDSSIDASEKHYATIYEEIRQNINLFLSKK